MNTKQCIVQSKNPKSTEEIGQKIGKNLRGGEVIELVGDVGSGKTTLVRGIAKGIGSKDHVSSPTFTLKKIYKSADLTLVHCDFYRLANPDFIEHELEDHLDDSTVVVVEWGKLIDHVLPKSRIQIKLDTTAENTREFTVHFPQEYLYIGEDIC